MTTKGLAKQILPIIALIAPGHFVIVESVTLSGVAVWDPDAKGPGMPGQKTYSATEWAKVWDGIALRALPGR